MSGKYIDFAPMNVRRPSVKGKVAPGMSAMRPTAPVEFAPKGEVVYEEVTTEEEITDVDVDTFSLKNEPEYGVIEDFRPKFVKTEVPKRPLSQKRSDGRGDDIAAAKAEKIVTRKTTTVVENSVENSTIVEDKVQDLAKMKIPKSPFISHAKVAKRPLSKNIYEKKIKSTAEEDTGLVTIITKPEKDKKAGLVVTIILTIILGAAAGTIAFLLLPK